MNNTTNNLSNTDNLASGVYIVNISVGNVTVNNTKVVNIK